MPLCWSNSRSSSIPRSNKSNHVYYMPTSPLSESALASSPTSNRRVSQVYHTESHGETKDGPFGIHHHVRRDSTEINGGRLPFGSSLSRSHSQSLAGSYEESLLKGRTATPCSAPLPFLSRIGVLGRGKCSAKLKCPPQINLDFTAVYYNWSVNEDSLTRRESPYVGAIDIEDGIYEIPRKGQLQIVVANPNKTPCALFLIPYELSKPTQYPSRSFIRNRIVSYTVRDDGISPSESFLKQTAHIPIVCTAHNTFYLSKSIKLIFNNQSLQSGIVGSSKDDSLVKSRDEPMTIHSNWAPISGDSFDHISPVFHSIPYGDRNDSLFNTPSTPQLSDKGTDNSLVVTHRPRPSMDLLSYDLQRIELRGHTNKHPEDFGHHYYLPPPYLESTMEAVLWPDMSRSHKSSISSINSSSSSSNSDDWVPNNPGRDTIKRSAQSKLTVGIKALENGHEQTN